MFCVLCQLFNYLFQMLYWNLGDHLCWCRFKLSFVNDEKYVCSLHLWGTCLWWEKTIVLKKGCFGFEGYNLPVFSYIGRCFCKCGWAVLLFLIPAALITRIWTDVFPLAWLCVTVLGKTQPAASSAVEQEHGKDVFVRLIVSCKTEEDSWSD